MKRLLMVMAVVTALFVGCGSDGEEPEGADAPPDATLLEGDAVEVKAIDNSFQPEAAQVAAGTEVTFVNDGQNDHNVVPEDEGADWAIDGDDFHPGDEQSFTFDDPGVYRYYCSLHGTIDAGMPGVLVVE
ncbi:MAG: plastocyanin/azurin family copper-binding protein [Acidimicrobiales bacterium]